MQFVLWFFNCPLSQFHVNLFPLDRFKKYQFGILILQKSFFLHIIYPLFLLNKSPFTYFIGLKLVFHIGLDLYWIFAILWNIVLSQFVRFELKIHDIYAHSLPKIHRYFIFILFVVNMPTKWQINVFAVCFGNTSACKIGIYFRSENKMCIVLFANGVQLKKGCWEMQSRTLSLTIEYTN